MKAAVVIKNILIYITLLVDAEIYFKSDSFIVQCSELPTDEYIGEKGRDFATNNTKIAGCISNEFKIMEGLLEVTVFVNSTYFEDFVTILVHEAKSHDLIQRKTIYTSHDDLRNGINNIRIFLCCSRRNVYVVVICHLSLKSGLFLKSVRFTNYEFNTISQDLSNEDDSNKVFVTNRNSEDSSSPYVYEGIKASEVDDDPVATTYSDITEINTSFISSNLINITTQPALECSNAAIKPPTSSTIPKTTLFSTESLEHTNLVSIESEMVTPAMAFEIVETTAPIEFETAIVKPIVISVMSSTGDIIEIPHMEITPTNKKILTQVKTTTELTNFYLIGDITIAEASFSTAASTQLKIIDSAEEMLNILLKNPFLLILVILSIVFFLVYVILYILDNIEHTPASDLVSNNDKNVPQLVNLHKRHNSVDDAWNFVSYDNIV